MNLVSCLQLKGILMVRELKMSREAKAQMFAPLSAL